MKAWRTAGIPLKLVNTATFIYIYVLLLRLCKKDRLISNTAKSGLSFKTSLHNKLPLLPLLGLFGFFFS